MNPGSGTTAQSFPERWIFLLAAIVILVAILAAISVMFIFKTPSHGQYNMALILVCFSLSSIAGLLFTAKVDIKGTIGVLTLTLGGTAVLWVATLIIVANIFPFQSILKPITLNGKVIDINRQDLKDYEIAHVIVHKSNDKGFFNFDSPPPPEKPYLFIVKKDGFVVPFNIDVPNPENIIIEGFPDPKKTRITGKILIDQRGRPVPSGYSLVITPKTTPESVVVQEGKSLEFDVEQGMYDIIFYDGEGRKYASRNMFDVRPGMPHSLPLDVTVMPGR